MASAKARGKMPEVIDLTKRQSAFQPHSGARKLIIKNLRSPVNHDARIQEYYARTEKELEGALDAIFNSRIPAIPLERLYRGVEDICRKGNADTVYRTLKDKVDSHLKNVILPKIQSAAKMSNLDVLKRTLVEWKTWNSQTVWTFPFEIMNLYGSIAHSLLDPCQVNL
jgi:cullin-4